MVAAEKCIKAIDYPYVNSRELQHKEAGMSSPKVSGNPDFADNYKINALFIQSRYILEVINYK